MTSRPARVGDGPLTGMSVLVCRALDQSETLTDELLGLGAEVVPLPLIEVVEPVGGTQALAAAGSRLSEFGWVIFTSANAVDSFAPHVTAWPECVRIAAVGPATAAAVERAGLDLSFVPEEATAADLARSLPAHTSGRSSRVLAPLAELAGPELAIGLQERGFEVERLVAYRTRSPEHDPSVVEAARQADAVLLTSRSSVDRLVELLGPDGVPSTVIAIGPSTAQALADCGLVATEIAEPHTAQGLIAALLRSLAP